MLSFDTVWVKTAHVVCDQLVHPSGAVLPVDPGDGCHRELHGQVHTALEMLLQAVLLDQLQAVGVSQELIDLGHPLQRTDAASFLMGQQPDHQTQRRTSVKEIPGHVHAEFLPGIGEIQGVDIALGALIPVQGILPELLGGIAGLDHGHAVAIKDTGHIIGEQLPAPLEKFGGGGGLTCAGIAGDEYGAFSVGDAAAVEQHVAPLHQDRAHARARQVDRYIGIGIPIADICFDQVAVGHPEQGVGQGRNNAPSLCGGGGIGINDPPKLSPDDPDIALDIVELGDLRDGKLRLDNQTKGLIQFCLAHRILSNFVQRSGTSGWKHIATGSL